MSVTDILCALECKLAYYTQLYKQAKKHGDKGLIKSTDNSIEELIWLKFLVKYNNFSKADECFDNCNLTEKLECYGLSGVS